MTSRAASRTCTTSFRTNRTRVAASSIPHRVLYVVGQVSRVVLVTWELGQTCFHGHRGVIEHSVHKTINSLNYK